MEKSILVIKNLFKRFPVKQSVLGKPREFVHAVNGVTLRIPRGKTVGLVGESGCGKTTIGKMIAGLEQPDSGEILFKEQPISSLIRENRKRYARKVQIIFQNPFASLNPRKRMYHTFKETLSVHRLVPPEKIEQTILDLLKTVHIPPEEAYKYPFEFSGGQQQRLCIARALAVQPELIVCDEPVSSLDVSVQAQILTLLKDLQKKFNLTYLFISHDLSVIYHISDYVYIMYLGEILEEGTVEEIFEHPKHPYTEALLSAIPVPEPNNSRKRIILKGEMPDPTRLPKGCSFYSRCPKRMERCREKKPGVVEITSAHSFRCLLPLKPA